MKNFLRLNFGENKHNVHYNKWIKILGIKNYTFESFSGKQTNFKSLSKYFYLYNAKKIGNQTTLYDDFGNQLVFKSVKDKVILAHDSLHTTLNARDKNHPTYSYDALKVDGPNHSCNYCECSIPTKCLTCFVCGQLVK